MSKKSGNPRSSLNAFRAFSLAALAPVVGTALSVSASLAQDFPERPVTLVVPYPAGGAIDVSARRLAVHLQEELGQSVVVENKPGANGTIGARQVATAEPDGYTLFFTSIVAHAANEVDYDNLPYDTFEDFESITVIPAAPVYLVANPSFPANNFDEFLALVRARPGEITYGTNGPGSPNDVRGIEIDKLANTHMNLVSYQGGSAATADVAGGHLDVYNATLPVAVPFVELGQMKVLAVLSPKRWETLPDVASITESPGFENFNEFAALPFILAPAGTPSEVVDRIYEGILASVNDPEFIATARSAGELDTFALTPAESEAMLVENVNLLRTLIGQ